MLKFNSEYYTDVDFYIQDYVLKNIDKIEHMSIREFAEKTNVSTATILRFCKKSGFSNFSNFKNLLKQHNTITNNLSISDNFYFEDIKRFFDNYHMSTIPKKITTIAEIINKMQIVHCVGVGNSGFVSMYASRILSQLNVTSIAITEPYFSIPRMKDSQGLAIVFSVSGETNDTLILCERLKQANYLICSITNCSNTHLARVSDYIIDYKVTNINRNTYIDQSTQIPPIFILEMLRETLKNNIQESDKQL